MSRLDSHSHRQLNKSGHERQMERLMSSRRKDVPVGGPCIPVIGAGFGGIAAVIALKQAGYRNVVVLEKGDEVGGVWRANTYPGGGMRCAVASVHSVDPTAGRSS
jgi:heterodisulfide reductase subunit A-like polyferredoxin